MKKIKTVSLALGMSLIAGTLGLSTSGSQANELNIVGTGDGVDLLKALGSAYNADNPGKFITVPASIGSGGGIVAVSNDEEILARIARPLKENEKAAGLSEQPFVRVPAAIYAHKSVRIDNLSAQQLADIYSGKITNWKDVGGANSKIKVVRREDADSTLQVLRHTMPFWNDLQFTKKSKIALTTQEAFDTVIKTNGAIGFGPYTKQMTEDYIVFKIDGKYPTDSNYPSATTISFAYKDASLTETAKDFIAYTKSDKAKTLLENMGAVPVE